MSTEFDKILNFDPLHEAEKITGKSYKEDPETEGLGFLFLQLSAKRKREELALRGDTYRGMPFMEAVELAHELGFTPIYAEIREDNNRKYSTGDPVHFYLFWRKGVLLKLESYGKEGVYRGLTVNSAMLYYNWMPDENTRNCPVHGSSHWTREAPGFDDDFESDPWVMVGSLDVREGLRHHLETLYSGGTVPEEWLYTDRLLGFALYSYAEDRGDVEKVPGEAWSDHMKKLQARMEERVELLPEPIRSMIFAGRRGKDWDDR